MKTLWLAFVVLVLYPAAALAEKKDVTFNAADGFALKGTLYTTEKGGPGILLLHDCSADRRGYDNLAMMLSTAGYVVLTFDARGFGASRAAPYSDFAAQREKILEKMPGDVETALAFLTSQHSVNPRAIGVVGGSSDCGANQAVHAGNRHEEVRSLVLLSGGTDAEGEAYLKRASKVAVLGLASEEDTAAAAATKKAVGVSTNSSSRVDIVKNAGHAASMFAKDPGLEADIVMFFRSNLPVGGYGLPPAIKK